MIGPSPRYLNSEPDYNGGFEKDSIMELLDMMEMNFVGWASYLAPISMKNEERPKLAEELQTSFSSSDPSITREFAEVIFFSDHREDLPKVTVPSFCNVPRIVLFLRKLYDRMMLLESKTVE